MILWTLMIFPVLSRVMLYPWYQKLLPTLMVAYLSVGFVLLLCPSIERLLYEAESHGFQEKSPTQYCRHILVLFCFDLPVILYFAYWWHIYLWDLCFFCVQVLSVCCMKLNHMVSRRNHLLNIVDTFWYYSALTFRSSYILPIGGISICGICASFVSKYWAFVGWSWITWFPGEITFSIL